MGGRNPFDSPSVKQGEPPVSEEPSPQGRSEMQIALDRLQEAMEKADSAVWARLSDNQHHQIRQYAEEQESVHSQYRSPAEQQLRDSQADVTYSELADPDEMLGLPTPAAYLQASRALEKRIADDKFAEEFFDEESVVKIKRKVSQSAPEPVERPLGYLERPRLGSRIWMTMAGAFWGYVALKSLVQGMDILGILVICPVGWAICQIPLLYRNMDWNGPGGRAV